MSEARRAEELKQEGNVQFKDKNFLKAAGLYTKAIKEEPENAILYSNRCAALIQLSKMTKAHTDADKVIELKPKWEKGYLRKASIYETQEEYSEALEWYKKTAECENVSPSVQSKIKNLTRLVKQSTKKQEVAKQDNGNRSAFSFDKQNKPL